jgi:hypothetical protein
MLKLIGRHTTTSLLLFALTAFGLGIYLAPSHREIALMQMNDFDFDVALKDFSSLHTAGDRSINVLAPLINLNIYYGDDDQAIALLESFVADHPRAIEGRKRLAELYKNTQRYDHYCQMLEEIQNLSPSTANLRELADTYNFLGRYKDEMSTLAQLIESKGYQPQEDDYIRLASYYRLDQQPDAAVRTIRDYIEDRYYKVGIEAVTLAVQLMLEQDDARKAYSLAGSFLKKRGEETDAITLSTLFEAQGQIDMAYNILGPYLDDMEKSPNLEQQVVDVMLAQKKDQDVYAMLSAQRAKEGTLAPALAVSLTDLAIERADYPMIETLIRAQDLETMPENALLRYANTAFQLKRPDLAQLMQAKLSADYLRQAPALAAVLAVAADDTPKSMAALTALPHDELSPEAKIVFASLYVAHSMPKPAFDLLDGIPVADVFNAFDAGQYAALYLDVGAAAKAEQILNDARPGSTPEVQASIDQILLMLAAGEGRGDFIQQKLADYEGGDSDLWPDVYDFAIQYHHEDTALAIAERLYKIDSSEANKMQLAEALLINHRYAESLNHLHGMIEKNPEARSLYLDALASWSEQSGGAVTMSSAERADFNTVIELSLKNPDTPADERQDLAYVLEQIGLLDQAATVLITLAAEQPHNSADVEDLIGFWQDHPSDRGKDWIENRARHASSDTEKALWLADLNDMEYPQAVLDVMRGESHMSPAVSDQYVEALADLHDKDQLATALEESIDSETNVTRLKNLAVMAQDEDAKEAAEKAWRKAYSLDSSDDEAAKEIGLIDFDQENYDDAKPLLNQYLQHHNEGDYRVNMAYGEILQQDEENSDAKAYFERALKQVSDIKGPDLMIEEDEAYLLYLSGNITESIAHYRRLLDQNPDDKDVRAGFAEVLMEAGKFDEASSLLSR